MSKFVFSSGLLAFAACAFACSSPSHSPSHADSHAHATNHAKASQEADEDDDEEAEEANASRSTKASSEESEAGDEVEVKLADAPSAVRAAALKLAPEASIKKVTRESDEGVTVYEVEYVVDGNECSADLSQDGAILELEKGVKAGSLPAAVSAALQKRFPGAEMKHAESVQAFYYEVKMTKDGKSTVVRVYASGAIEEEQD